MQIEINIKKRKKRASGINQMPRRSQAVTRNPVKSVMIRQIRHCHLNAFDQNASAFSHTLSGSRSLLSFRLPGRSYRPPNLTIP